MDIERALETLKDRKEKSADEVEEAVKIAIRILPYSIDMPVLEKHTCPCCEEELTDRNWDFCPFCGQAIKWREENEKS